MCNAGFADDDGPRAVRISISSRPIKPRRPIMPGTMDGGVPKVPGVTDGMNQNVCRARDDPVELLVLNVARCQGLTFLQPVNVRPQRTP